jgi:Arc/MetJ-type ribon-helix-helix transcriptional regulator
MSDEFIGFRIPSDLKHQIQEKIDAGEYRDMTTFVLETIREKLDPSKRNEALKKNLIELLRDPVVRKELGMD